MRGFMKLAAVTALCVAAAACSNDHSTPEPHVSAPISSATVLPASSAIPMHAPAAGASSVTAAPVVPQLNAPALSVILRRPVFAQAFAAMGGASSLPTWVRTGDSSAPSMRVKVDGRTMWLSHVCKAADCRGDQLFLLTDPARHTMQGLFLEMSGPAGASVRKLVWLGKPDTAERTFLAAQPAGS
jgi:Inhibitor of vertebrate lysozyme (Ivy)